MSDSEWYILVDEDIEPRVVEFLEKEGIRADRVPDVLFQGADDEADVMPYARNHILTAIEHYSNPDNLDGWDKLEYWLTQSRR